MAIRLVASLLFLSALTLAGCSSEAPLGAEGAIHGNTFDPATFTIDKGERIHFANHDSVEHSVTADGSGGGSFDRDIEGGEEGDVTFPNAGTFTFHCKYHASMRGSVTVR
jgi:plastocyanin